MNVTPTETKTSIETSLTQVNFERGSISHALAVLRQKQGRIIVSTVLFAVLSTLLVIFAYLSAPSIERSLLWFSPVFDGCDQGFYPNGMKFSSNDLLASQILDQVYSEKSISKFMDLMHFKNSVFVLRSAEGLRSLQERYGGLFSASSSPIGAEKQQQFQEYLTAKSKILSQAAYCVCFSSPHSENVPKTIRTEVLTGILEEWARSSEKKRYVKKYPIAAIDKTFFDDLSLDKEEPILRLLKLRAISRNIENTIDFLGTYRGAVDVKTASGTNILSLQTIVNNVIRNKIPLLAGTVRNGRLYKNFIISSQYVKASLFDLRLDEEMQKERVAQAKKVQESYLNNVSPLTSDSISSPARDSVPFTGMLIPQIGETFLDRLIKLSQESQDTKYRQSLSDRIIEEGVKLLDIQQDIAFYQNLLPKEISKGTTPPETLEQHKRHSNIFEGRFRDAIEQLRQVNRELIIIRDLLSDIQLEANSKLYRVLGDVEHQSVSRMSPKKTIFLVILMIFLFYCFSSFGVLGLEYFQKKE